MNEQQSAERQETPKRPAAPVASELNNLLQIIAGTTDLLENIWQGADRSERYISMLRSSVDRAARVTAQMVEHAGANDGQIVLPSPSSAEPLVEPPIAILPDPASKKGRVLVVDDDLMTLGLFDRLLREQGYDVTLAESAFSALDALCRREPPINVVVLDYTMPFMSGDETFRRIRAISPELPVFLTTGFIEQQLLDSMFASGLAGYLRKPISPAELQETIAKVLSAKCTLPEASAVSGIAAAM